ncbi:MAG: Xaa-Pro peptidase family protein [Armatimonadota bacterium]|nr:Xaa-Pro peptidase family protein [Armatimonadota bacterium]MDR7448929.1 Xaa-Pro peptidase family protein [Armatimonadota bacterium]MDR7460419.1 Xaa-Pro peptidase family protein [Armatimonadota bacterium]MDR7480566.1 Xaa-Pro peptidase family protein [Armatimonadota bacterium]MDR7489250.1 Xaa-Pro peptidase family protein [Armatimonadota bacterium]
MNTARAAAVLAEQGWEGLVATTAENVRYLSGFRSFTQPLLRTTQVYAVARRDRLDAPLVVAPVAEVDMAAQFPPRGDLIPYGRFFIEAGAQHADAADRALVRWACETAPHATALDALVAALRQLDLLDAAVGVDEGGLAHGGWEALAARAPGGFRMAPAADSFRRIRAVKTAGEVAALERATEALLAAVEATLGACTEGMTEREAALVFDQAVLAAGARPLFTVLAFGPHTAYPNAVPGDRPLRRGDLIRFDVGAVVDGYCADIARTASCGEPAAAVRAAYRAILVGQDGAVTACRPGATAGAVFTAAVAATQRAGLPHYRRHHVGHGIGLEVYEPPLLADGVETPLEVGMVFEVETPYYEVGLGGLQVEDTVVVTASGPTLLCPADRELRVVEP